MLNYSLVANVKSRKLSLRYWPISITSYKVRRISGNGIIQRILEIGEADDQKYLK